MTIENVDPTEMGPVDYVLIEFSDGKPKAELGDLLLDLADRRIIRVIDLLFVRKDADGNVSALAVEDLDDVGVGDFAVFEGASSGLLGDDDLATTGEAMENDTAAALIVYENRWAAPFAIRVRELGGRLAAFDRIPVQALIAALEDAEVTA